MSLSDVFSVVTLVVGVIGLAAILWQIRSGTSDRDAEDDARAFFEEHGRWPDETPEEVLARQTVQQIPVVEPDEQGRV